jgi:hypothetical protein
VLTCTNRTLEPRYVSSVGALICRTAACVCVSVCCVFTGFTTGWCFARSLPPCQQTKCRSPGNGKSWIKFAFNAIKVAISSRRIFVPQILHVIRIMLLVSCKPWRRRGVEKSFHSLIPVLCIWMGHAVAQLVEALRYKPERRGFDSRWCQWNVWLTWSFRSHYGPGVDSASNRNKYQESFLGGNGGRCVGLTTLSPSCTDCLKTWDPRPPGALRSCPGQ